MKEASTPMYTEVPFAKLKDYLEKKASVEEVNYIEVTDITEEALSEPDGTLCTLLNESGKKVALKLPEAVEDLYIMPNCFEGCTALVSLAAIPDGVVEIPYCFSGCTNLIKAPKIPDSITCMGGCFSECTSLTEAPEIPDSVTDMRICFSGCTSLTKAPVIPGSVTNMGDCFKNCIALTTAPAIPCGVTDMSFCFSGCTSLIEVPTMPRGVMDTNDCFNNCTSLTAGSITVPASELEHYRENAAEMGAEPAWFKANRHSSLSKECVMETAAVQTYYVQIPFAELEDYLQNTASTEEVNYIEVTDITAADLSGDEISSLGKLLKKYGKAVALKLPETIENIDRMDNCFCECGAIISLAAIPDGVTTLWGCFVGCTNLTQAPVIPDSVTDMDCCFQDCTSLTQVPILPKGIERINNCFSGCTSLTAGSITVPASELVKYQTRAAEMGADPAWFKSE